MKILNQGFDHVEFIVSDAAKHAALYERMGFERIGERQLPAKGTRTLAYAQGAVRILLTEPENGAASAELQDSVQFLRKHGEGICVLALEVDDAAATFRETVARGARPAREPEAFESAEGSVIRAEIWTPADVRYAFIERRAAGGTAGLFRDGPVLLDEGLVASRLESPAPLGIRLIDHLTNNVDMGELKVWTEWYQKIFGFELAQHFEIKTGRTGLSSDVVQSKDLKVKVPVNQATERESQVQEFVDRMKGAGVQHLALLTSDILETVARLRKNGFTFLSVPHTYYEAVPRRIQGVEEDIHLLEDLGILVDGEQGTGYLLQIFTSELVGPFFLEFIQRKGDQGFGNGNFRALFEAIERDQIKRGVLRA